MPTTALPPVVRPSRRLLTLALLGCIGTGCWLTQARAQNAPSNTVRLRAEITAMQNGTMTIRARNGEVVDMALAPTVNISEVYAIDIAEIKPNSYVGSGALPQADGTLKAVEVLVFPEAMRGAGEGHRPWDLLPQSTMTNATVEAVTTGAQGGSRTLKLKYKDGEKTLFVPPEAPVVTFRPGDASLLVVGAKIIVTGELRDGKPTAVRIVAGRNGFQPPM